MAAFVLVHGSCHGAWCWRDVAPALEARGHRVAAIDLPAHGEDPTPATEATLDGYAERIVAAVTAAAPAILVAHSAGGVPATVAADQAPERLRHLAYVCAYVPRSGDSVADLRRGAERQPLRAAIRVSPDGVSYSVDPQLAPGIFFHDCPQEAVAYALPRLCPEPVAPHETPASLTGGVAEVRRSYVLCTEDRTVPPEEQARMVAKWPCEAVIRLASGHSPFFSRPAELAGILDGIARKEAAP